MGALIEFFVKIFCRNFGFGTPFANKLIKKKVSLVVNNRVIAIDGLVVMTKPSVVYARIFRIRYFCLR